MKTIRLDGVVGWEITAADVARELEGQKEVKMVINSGGGDILEGFAIYNAMKDSEVHIDVHVDFAASMASVFALAGDSVTMKGSSSIMMIHRPWGVTGGNSEDLRAHADTLDKLEVMLVDIYAEKSGMERAEIEVLLADETYMDAKEALEFGFIDQIESGKSDFAAVAMAGMKAQKRVDFDCGKLVAKIDVMKGSKKPVRDTFSACSSLADVEAVMRQEFNLSRAEATAIVAAVRKTDHGDRDQKVKQQDLLNFLNNFKLGDHHE